MATTDPVKSKNSQQKIRGIVELCSDCDTCRTLMDEACCFFPELYRLWDNEKTTNTRISDVELRNLTNLCTMCGLCPCPNVPAAVMAAKSGYIKEEGLPLTVRLKTNVPQLARFCGTFPRLINALNDNKTLGPLLKKATQTHLARQFPVFHEESFFQWAKKNGLTNRKIGVPTVSYFAGCTAGYLFPDVGRALVKVLEQNGLTVWVPPQECCGMPHLLEGDRTTTLRRVQANLDQFLESTFTDDDLIFSCPSCGFFMKILLKEGACYSEAYQLAMNAGVDEIKVPDPRPGDKKHHRILKKSAYKDILQDDGLFSTIDPLKRVLLADRLSDAGLYLNRLHCEGRLDTRFNSLSGEMVYFAPCHQREQNIGLPYLDLLRLIPGISVTKIGGELDCCGMGGNFGFKNDFHDKSLAVGRTLIKKIQDRSPQAVITDCMSCRLQFQQMLSYPIYHPIEVLAKAYTHKG